MTEGTPLTGSKLPPGTILPRKEGKYTLEKLIGEGKMADVYATRDKDFRKIVSLKILHQRYYSDQVIVERFLQEARAASDLSHDNIASVFNVGKFDDWYCISMEYVAGRTLKEILREMETFYTLEQACDIIMPTLSALEYAHKNGIVHRDVKPGNIMVRTDGKVKLLDFGIAKILEKEDQPVLQLTEMGTYVGTLQFMSPEQMISSSEVTQKSDVFSAGVILYKMLTGILPFENEGAESDGEAMVNTISKNLIRPSELNPALSKEVDYMLSRALKKNPKERYSAEEFLTDLRRQMDKQPIMVLKDYDPEFYVDPKVISRRRFIKIGAGVVSGLIALGAGGAIFMKRYHDIGSLLPVIDEIESTRIDSMEKLIPYLMNLYPRLSERLEWFYEKDFEKRIERESRKEKPRIFPLGTLTAEGYLGRFTYLTGEGTYSGEVVPFLYYLFDDLKRSAQEEKDPNKRLKFEKRSRETLDDIVFCASKLHFAEHSDVASGTALSDRTARAVHRFHPPCAEFVYSLKRDHSGVYQKIEKELKPTVENYAKAIKMAVEHVVRRTIEGLDKYSSWNDSEFALLLCDGFRLLDIQKRVIESYEYLGSKTKNVYGFVELLTREADEKIDKLTMQEAWRQGVSNNEYFGLMNGLVQRKILLRDILNGEDTKFDNNELFKINIMNAIASSNISESGFFNYISREVDKLDQAIQEMGDYGIPLLFKSAKPGYYLQSRPDNPHSIYHLGYLLGLNAVYDRPDYVGISKKEVDLYVLLNILTKEHVVENLRRFRGFFKNTIPSWNHEASRGGTNIAFDRSVYKRIREIVYEE